MASAEQENDVDAAMHCPECGEEISRKAEICPECGVRVREESGGGEETKTRIGKTGYVVLGVVSGLVAFVLLPIVLGPISIFSGVKLFKHHDERWGVGIMILGGAGLVIGTLIGMLAVT